MDATWLPLVWTLAALLVLAGLAGTVFPVLPGAPLVFGGLWLLAWSEQYQRVGAVALGLIGALAGLSLLVDVVASALGAQRVGASPKALLGATLGSLVGLFFGLPGLLLGPFVGALLGELAARGGLAQATRVGVATWLGLLLGALAKLALALAMLVVFAIAWWW